MSFVDEVLDLEPAEPHSFAQFQNVGDSLSRGLSRGTKMEGNGLLLREGFQSPLDDLFGRLIKTACELLLKQLLAMRCQANGTHI